MVDKGLQRVGGRGFLDDSEDGDLYTIHGIAIGAGDVTLGSTSGERKYWSEEVLRESASTLEGKQIVANHENRDIYSVVGSVTDASYSENKKGVVFQGVVDEELLAKRINRGWLDVSPRIIHTSGEVDENGIKHPDKIKMFDNLAIVSKGAAQSNEVSTGESEELSVEELQSHFEDGPEMEEVEFEQFEELQEFKFTQYMYDNPEGAEGASQGFGCEGFHEVDFGDKTMYMPCQNRDNFLANVKEREQEEAQTPEHDEIEEELAEQEFTQGDYVTWDNGSAHGKVVDTTTNGTYDSEIDGDVSVSGTEDDPAALIDIYQDVDGSWEKGEKTVAHKFSTLNKWDVDIDELSQHMEEASDYSSEEMRIASQMASQSKMTKSECLSFMDLITPSRSTDIPRLSGIISNVLSERQREAMAKHLAPESMGSDSDDGDSVLNKMFK
jgi:hypothetical protein